MQIEYSKLCVLQMQKQNHRLATVALFVGASNFLQLFPDRNEDVTWTAKPTDKLNLMKNDENYNSG